MRNVRKVYECSLSHLPEDSIHEMASEIKGNCPIPTMQNEWAMLVHVPENLDDWRARGVTNTIIHKIAALAIDAGCDFILFDVDVTPVEYLQEFP